MKPLKLALISFVIGVAMSAASIAAYACAGTLYVQDQSNCHMYTRYVFAGSSSEGGVEICAYVATSGAKHREDTCDAGFIL